MNERTTNEILDSIDRGIGELMSLLVLVNAEPLKAKFEALFVDPKKLLVYQASTEERSTRQVATIAGVSDSSVREWWKEWAEAGLVRETSTAGRFERRFDLRRFGVVVPRSAKSE